MSLFSNENNLLTKEIESWKGFEYALREENRSLFNKMIEECKREEYANAVNAKGLQIAYLSKWQTQRCSGSWPPVTNAICVVVAAGLLIVTTPKLGDRNVFQ